MARTWLLRVFVVVATNIVVFGVLIAPAYADCIDAYNGVTYCASYYGCGSGVTQDYFYAQVATQNGPCVWRFDPVSSTYRGSCPYVDNITEGGKTTLSDGGLPSTYTTSDHAAAYIQSLEIANCTNFDPSRSLPGCWVQVGWTIGYGETYPTCLNFNNYHKTIQTNGAVHVYVEIYDDTQSPCFLGDFGQAPTNASYDARYYTTDPGPTYRYEVYYQAPGGGIQNLAYGVFKSQTTAETVTGEALIKKVGANYPNCTVLGQSFNNWWNVAGQATSPSTFASSMSLYKAGSWQLWTSSVASTRAYIWPPNGQDVNLHGDSSNPYLYQPISNFAGGNFTQWKFGGPTN
jgi:hypothetical protein